MKRIRNYKECPNPLFEKWLKEWKTEAALKNPAIVESFEKALNSLKKYPLPLKSGRECKILMHFSDKLCNMIDKQLAQNELPNNPANNDPSKKLKVKENSSENEKCVLAKEKSKSKIKTAQFPQIGSGAYSILLVMYQEMQNENYPGFMLKKDLQIKAQKYCNADMQKVETDYTTGWAAMSNLILKNLVFKRSCPAKYSLTDTGVALAKTLLNSKSSYSKNSSDNEDTHNSSNKSSNDKTFSLKNVKYETKISPLKVKSVSSEKNSNASKNSKPSVLCIDLTENGSSSHDNKCNDDKTSASDMKENIKSTTKTTIETVDEMEIESVPSPEYEQFCIENAEPVITVKRKDKHFVFSEYVDTDITNINNIKETESRSSKVKELKMKDKVVTVTQKQQSLDTDSPITSFYLLPNNFDIILLVDTQEINGCKANPKNDETLSGLSDKGILFEVRSLKIGDYTWIARCKFTNKELVLPYIIERKQIDDLASSIKDGRYREQKHRLKQSGIKNIIYLIESFGKKYYGSIPLTTLHQAAVNSLVQNNFIVKFTSNHKDSLKYLETMTKKITKIYESKELISCKKQDLITHSSDTLKLMEFNDFNKSSSKTKNFKVREMFILQLMQLKGISVDKAMAITELYQTPSILAEAFKKNGEKLLADVEIGSNKNKIGPFISSAIYQLYNKQSLN